MTLKDIIDDALARTPVVAVSKLDRAEVLRRLKEAVDSEWTFGGRKAVVGRVDDSGFRLRMRIGYRNSFQTFIFGTVQADGRGSRLAARSGMHPFAAVFMMLWLTVVGFAATLGVAGALQATPDESMPAIVLLVLVGMLAFGAALVGIGRWVARAERAQLIAFLESAAEAKAR